MTNSTLPPSVPRRLLAILINHPAQLASHRAQLDQITFADPRDRAIYRALKATVSAATDAANVDVADVLHHLEATNALANVGGREYVLGLLDEPGTLATQPLPRLVEAVVNDFARRAAVERVEGIGKAISEGVDHADLMRMLNEEIAPLALLGQPKWAPLGASTADLIAHFQNPARKPALPTGIPALDELIGGLYPTQLITIAGSTSMGKSSLAGQIALTAAHVANEKPGHFGAPDGKVAPVLIFSFEMPAREFHTRMVGQRSPVAHGYHPRRGWLNDDKTVAIDGAKKLAHLPIYVFDETPPTAEAVRAQVEAFSQEQGTKPGLVIVDHIGLMRHPRLTNPTEVMSHVSGALKTMAQQLDIPVIEVAQLSREHGKREDHRPTLFDLKQSGDVENNSNVVLLVHRQSKFLADDERKAAEEGGCPAEIIVAKNRHGETGTVNVGWLGYRTLFVPDPQWVPDYGSSEFGIHGGIIEWPTLDRSAFAHDASATSAAARSAGVRTNGSGGRPIHPEALLAYFGKQGEPVTYGQVRDEFQVSIDTARAAVDLQVVEGELDKVDLGAGHSPRYRFALAGYAARQFEEMLSNDAPF